MLKLRKLCRGMDSVLNCLKSNSAIRSSNNVKWNRIPEIIFRLPYARKVGEKLLKRCLKKVKHYLNSNVKFRVLYNTKKISYCIKLKIKFLVIQETTLFTKSSVLVAITRLTEHGTKETEPMFKNLSEC